MINKNSFLKKFKKSQISTEVLVLFYNPIYILFYTLYYAILYPNSIKSCKTNLTGNMVPKYALFV